MATHGRRHPGTLVLAWIAYWILLLAVTFGSAVPLVWRLSRPGQHGDASFALGSDGLRLTISTAGRVAWELAASAGALAFWIAVPPLVILVLWLTTGRDRGPEVDVPVAPRDPALAAGDGRADRALGAPAPDFTVARPEREPAREPGDAGPR